MEDTKPESQPAQENELLSASAKENIEVVADAYGREHANASRLQAAIESVSTFFGSPNYFVFVLSFAILWIIVNLSAAHWGLDAFDEPPFFWLQGIVSFNALLLTVAVLIRQNRMAQLAEHRAHLDLQINLLTERKVTKLIAMLDGLRKTSPALSEQHDEDIEDLLTPADAEAMLEAIKDSGAVPKTSP